MSLIPFKKNSPLFERRSEDFFSNFPAVTTPEFTMALATPAVNVSETEKYYTITTELPGVEDKNIEISVTDNTVQIKGNKELSKEEKENGFIAIERSYGSFYRSIPFSTKIDENKVKAVLKDGVLTVEVPKTFESIKNTRKVSIQKI